MIELSYQNCLQTVIGKNGLKIQDLRGASGKIKSAADSLERLKKSGKLGFFDLPRQIQTAKKIQEIARTWRGKFENFVIVGIGGSALGNIALQSALRHPNWNLLSGRE